MLVNDATIGEKFYKAIIVSDELYNDSKENLKNLGIKIINSFVNNNVNSYLSKHADMQIVRVGENEYVCAPECYEYYKKSLKNFDVKITKGETYLSSNYPEDIAYNIVVTQKYLVHKLNSTDSVLKERLKGRTFIDVNQGYTACNLCKVSDNVFITSDLGIIKSMSGYNADILTISKGNIVLKGFDYGFFAGSSFMIGPQTLAINGNLMKHPDCNKIFAFCNEKNIEIVSLSENMISDVGSAVPII